ncbi:MAG: hypothetical protein K2Y22_11360 [Candidatus Obscuribacterales bacterium]|nr:hypothetical protein [Candidatus Obscuribacterales bacterium]
MSGFEKKGESQTNVAGTDSRLWDCAYSRNDVQADKDSIVAAYNIPGYPNGQDKLVQSFNNSQWHKNFILINNPVSPEQIVDELLSQVKEHGKPLGNLFIGAHGFRQGGFTLGGYKYGFGDPKVLSAFSRLKNFMAPGSCITFNSCEAGAGELAPIGLQKLADATGANVKAFEWDQYAGLLDGVGPAVEKAPSLGAKGAKSSLDEGTVSALTAFAESQDAETLAKMFSKIPQQEHLEAVFLMGLYHDRRVREGVAKDNIVLGSEKTADGSRLFVDLVKKHPSLFGVTNLFWPDRSKIFREEIKGKSIEFKNDFDNQWGIPRASGLSDEWH